MNFADTKFDGLYVIEPDMVEDKRGYFSRFYCKESFERMGITSLFSQSSISFNKQRGTLRGMHYQAEPFEEDKLVSCIKGAVYDVVIDLRKTSKTYEKWFSVELSAYNRKSIFIPKGFAHGFQTLESNTEVLYHISGEYVPEYSRGIRWDDVSFKIDWPLAIQCISERDSSFLSYRRQSS